MNTILALGMPGGWEWIIIGLIVVIFFGAKKIPDIFRGFGKGIREKKKLKKIHPKIKNNIFIQITRRTILMIYCLNLYY